MHNSKTLNFGCIFTTPNLFLLHNRALKGIPREFLMYFDGSYFIVGLLEGLKPERGSRALKKGYFSPKTLESGGMGKKKGGSIDPLDPPILTGLLRF